VILQEPTLLLANVLLVGALASASVVSRPKPPQRLAIYYGFPSLVNGSKGDVGKAAQVFSRYDVVVFGDGLEFGDVDTRRQPAGAGPDEQRKTRDLISLLRRSEHPTSVYGYITLGNSQKLPLPEIERRAVLWAQMGVQGIFLDEAGYDFGNTRSRQNAAVEAIHRLRLGAFMNAYRPEDLFSTDRVARNAAGGGNPEGNATVLGSKDIFLLESFQVREGQYEDGTNWYRRSSHAVAYRDQFGARVFAVTTSLQGQSFVHSKFEYAWWSALLWGLDGFAWGEPGFSTSDNALPWRDTPTPIVGTRFISSVSSKGPAYSRRTDRGTILVDTAAHVFAFVPNSPTEPKRVHSP
jgi:hypothetical protein